MHQPRPGVTGTGFQRPPPTAAAGLGGESHQGAADLEEEGVIEASLEGVNRAGERLELLRQLRGHTR